ncbi:hypothetical protein V6N11_038029, partial [Hibiscus sabdariffa]
MRTLQVMQEESQARVNMPNNQPSLE